jgi:hypothetical protein
MNIVIVDNGALGDQCFKNPAMRVLRPHVDQLWVTSKYGFAEEAMLNTGLADGVITKPDGFSEWPEYEQQKFMISASNNIDFDVVLKTQRCIPGRLNFHKGYDKQADKPVEWRREINAGKNYFDEMSNWLDVPAAVGVRPATNATSQELNFLNAFRSDYGIPADAFLLGWQLQGSCGAKRTPQFVEVVRAILEKYPFVYLVCMGDLDAELRSVNVHPRITNMYELLSFREAYLLTSKFDCFVSPNTGVFIWSQCFPKVPKILLSCLIDGHHCCYEETTVLQSTAECSPCYNILSMCKQDNGNDWFYCAGKIKAKRVIAAIEEVLKVWPGRR